MPDMIMLVGLPGCGKSTWIKDQGFWDRTNVMILSTDNYIQTVADGEGKTYSEVFPSTIKAAERNVEECLQIAIDHDMDIVWDQTNLSQASRRKKLQKIPAHYHKVATVFPVPEDHVKWLSSPERVGKVIPAGVLNSMKATYQQPTKDEGFDEIVHVNLNG
jgi:predicted kinase